MRRTSVYLAEGQAERLSRLAREGRRSQADVLREALDRYEPAGIADLDLGLADCALIVRADRSQTDRILSIDERHLRAVRPLHGRAFTLLPSDA